LDTGDRFERPVYVAKVPRQWPTLNDLLRPKTSITEKPEILNKLTNGDSARASIILRRHYCWLHENGSLGEEETTAPPTGTVSLVGLQTGHYRHIGPTPLFTETSSLDLDYRLWIEIVIQTCD